MGDGLNSGNVFDAANSSPLLGTERPMILPKGFVVGATSCLGPIVHGAKGSVLIGPMPRLFWSRCGLRQLVG